MKRLLVWLITVSAAAVFCWCFPLFHIVPLKRAAEEKAAAVFNPSAFADDFWNKQLQPSLTNAVNAEVLLQAIQSDAAAARRRYSHSLGLGDGYTYFLSGKGRVLTVTDDEITLTVTGSATPEISLQVGLLFGNSVRDGTGLLNVNAFPNSQDFNAISEALNHIVETRVLPSLRSQAKVGAIVSFIGCAEVNDESIDLQPLKVVPVQAHVP